jgi:hypothetical protein
VAAALKAWFEPHLAPRRTPDGYWVPPHALLGPVRVDDASRHVLVGRGAVLGALATAGRATLTRAVHVKGPLACGAELVLGAGCRVEGPVTVQGRAVLQASQARSVEAAGDVLLLGDCRVGRVRSGGDIVIVGAPRTGSLEPQGRVATRPW